MTTIYSRVLKSREHVFCYIALAKSKYTHIYGGALVQKGKATRQEFMNLFHSCHASVTGSFLDIRKQREDARVLISYILFEVELLKV